MVPVQTLSLKNPNSSNGIVNVQNIQQQPQQQLVNNINGLQQSIQQTIQQPHQQQRIQIISNSD